MALIGITGLKRSGKDTAADYLTSTYGFKRYAFADPMREALMALNPKVGATYLATLVDYIGWESAKSFPEVRRLLQRLGTEMGRDLFGEDFWVDRTFSAIHEDPSPHVVITDVRFPNEYSRVIAEGGIILRTVRPGLVAADPHPSELLASQAEEFPAHTTLHNSGDFEHLYAQLRGLEVLRNL